MQEWREEVKERGREGGGEGERDEVRERGMREEVRKRGVREEERQEEREGGGSEGGGAIGTASTYRRTASVSCPIQQTL